MIRVSIVRVIMAKAIRLVPWLRIAIIRVGYTEIVPKS